MQRTILSENASKDSGVSVAPTGTERDASRRSRREIGGGEGRAELYETPIREGKRLARFDSR